MKRSQVKKHAPLLYSILQCKNVDARNVILSSLSDANLDLICDCLRDIIYAPHKLGIPAEKIRYLRNQLQKDKTKLLYLANKSGNRKRKRKIISNQTGKGIGIALPTALPFIIRGIKSLINRKKK